jgi:hypothetical protein
MNLNSSLIKETRWPHTRKDFWLFLKIKNSLQGLSIDQAKTALWTAICQWGLSGALKGAPKFVFRVGYTGGEYDQRKQETKFRICALCFQ